MANIQCSGYHHGDSFLHNTKSRNKLFLALLFIFASGIGGVFVLLVIALFCHLGMMVSGIPILEAWKRLAALKIFLVILGGMHLFFTPGTPVQLFDTFALPITREGFECGIYTVSRLALMILISMILVWTTSPVSLMKTVTEFVSKFFPRSKFLQEFVVIGVLAFQMLPYLLAEAEKKIGSDWKQRYEIRKQGNLFNTTKSMVRSLMTWTVTVLADPDRLIGRKEEP